MRSSIFIVVAACLSAPSALAQGSAPTDLPPLDGGVTVDSATTVPPGLGGALPGEAMPSGGTAIDSGASQGTQPANRMPTGPELLPGLIDSQIQKCWSVPVMKGDPAEGGLARIRVKLLPDGTLESPPAIMDKPAGPKGLVFAESAARAITKCAPYKLPPEQYGSWKDITLYFDTLDF